MSNQIVKSFFEDSCQLLQRYEKRGRYFHTLKQADNCPLIVHRMTSQLTYVIKGSGFACLNGVIQEISQGVLVYIQPNVTHRFTANEEGITLFHIHIPDDGRESDREIIEGMDYDRYQ